MNGVSSVKAAAGTETRHVLFITYAYDDPDEAPVEDVSGSLKKARYWMKGRTGFVYRVERQPDGVYANEQFVEYIGPEIRK